MDNKKIGLFLKELRIKRGMSQKGIAEVCNVSHQAVSKWEKGENLPDLTSLQSLASYYMISIDELLAGELDMKKRSNKTNNNFNKEIIKITMSFFVLFVAFLPFLSEGGETYTGYELLFDGDFGLGVMTLATVLAYIIFQLSFSIFTIFRVISFSSENVYLNRSITVIVLTLVWFSIAISALIPYPYIVYLVYLGSVYLVNTRVLKKINMGIDYAVRNPKYEPYVYLLFYFIVLSIVPIYLVVFDDWYQGIFEFLVPVTVIVYLISISVFIYGFIKRNKSSELANYCKVISVHSMRILYIIVFYFLYTNPYILDFTDNTYDGIMFVIVYISFELLISSKYNQSLELKGDTVPIFKK